MASFSLSAPGKIILFGEHSVVYGKTAIAASIGLRTHLKFQENNYGNININFQTIELSCKFPVQVINAFIEKLNEKSDTVLTAKNINHQKFLEHSISFLEKSSQWDEYSYSQRSALTSFMYLLAGISISEKFIFSSGFNIDLKSDLRVGAGLGSSASFSVILAGCFLKHMTKLTDEFEKSQLEQISQWAFCSEKIMHGNPSGLDNCLCTFGSIVQYRKNEEPVFLNLEASNSNYQAILVDTTVPRQTKTMVSNVRTLINNHESIGNKILDAMDDLAQKAAQVLMTNDEDKISTLKDLIRINQGLLVTLGVSHPTITKICEMAADKNFASKLTGAGGGGYCIVIPFGNEKDIEELIQEFIEEGFPAVKTTLGGAGLTID